jgi:hypothetical protein
MKNHDQYAVKILGALNEVFNEDSEYFIGIEELKDQDNLPEFFHALANTVPNMVYEKITGDDKNNLEFNHLANQLCFQFCTVGDNQEK